MTPERVKYFVDKAWPMSGGDPLDHSIAIAITLAVNEAYDRAAIRGRITQIEGGLVDDAIRTLKLPEGV